jgi:hypothetical protein
MKPITFPRFLRTLRYIIRDLCWMVAYVAGAVSTVGVAKAVWMIISETTKRMQT